MALSADEVRYIASLARLSLDDDEVERLAPQLSRILEYADQVSEIAAEDVEATFHPYPLHNVVRDDEVRPSLPREDLLAAAPEVEDDRFVVPRIVAEQDVSPARAADAAEDENVRARGRPRPFSSQEQ